MKLRYEFLFYAAMALAMLAPKAHADDTLTLNMGDQWGTYTGDLLTLRWGTHQIEFDASEYQHWADHDTIFNGAFMPFDFWTIDVQYNHMFYHIPMLCAVTVVTRYPEMQYDVTARCRGE